MNCISFAIKALGRKSLFSCELEQKLYKKGYKSSEINETLARLKDLGYLDDNDLSKQLILSYLDKGKGFYWIKLKLKERSGKASLEHLELITEERERAASKIALKHCRNKDLAKTKAFLYRRGFRLEFTEIGSSGESADIADVLEPCEVVDEPFET